MYFLLTLFFISLIVITFMLGRKFLMLQNGQAFEKQELIFKTPHFQEWKYMVIKNIKKYGYAGLVVTIRLYFRSANLLVNKYQEIKIEIKNRYDKKRNKNPNQQKEVSKFLKVISEYKHKIRKIKHKIKEEEENL